MYTNFYKMPDAEFALWFGNFMAGLEAHKTDFNLTDEQFAEINGVKTEFQTALNEKRSTDELVKAKNLNLQNNRKKSNEKVAFYNKILKLNNIPDSLMSELGLGSVSETATAFVNPVPVTNLLVNGFAGGINSLKWNRNNIFYFTIS